MIADHVITIREVASGAMAVDTIVTAVITIIAIIMIATRVITIYAIAAHDLRGGERFVRRHVISSHRRATRRALRWMHMLVSAATPTAAASATTGSRRIPGRRPPGRIIHH